MSTELQHRHRRARSGARTVSDLPLSFFNSRCQHLRVIRPALYFCIAEPLCFTGGVANTEHGNVLTHIIPPPGDTMASTASRVAEILYEPSESHRLTLYK